MSNRGRARAAREAPLGRPALRAIRLVCAAAVAFVSAGHSAIPEWPEPEGGERPLLSPDRIKAETVVVLAHPDDEGVVAPLVARYARGEGQRVVHLYLTSGELGTNRVGMVRGPALGHLRLTELHWTLDRLGVAMFHTLGREDTGGTNNPAAVLDGWGREGTVGELTRHLRLLRPDRVLAWFPGPASSHAAHAASGAAALQACRAAANPASFPEQIATEGLRPHEVPEVWLFAQPEKVAYEPYPSAIGITEEARSHLLEARLDLRDGLSGLLYTDIAREAMREQRTVEATTFTSRLGPFEEPLILMRAWGGSAGEPLSLDAIPVFPVQIGFEESVAQEFLEALAGELDAPRLTGFFLPEAAAGPDGRMALNVKLTNTGKASLRGKASLELPAGWAAGRLEQELDLAPQETRILTWEPLTAPSPRPLRVPVGVRFHVGRRGGAEIRSSFVVMLPPDR